MLSALILAAGLLAASPEKPSAKADLDAYQAARARARRDPEAHLALALWCELHGLRAEAQRHLATTVLLDPKHAKARALLGLVAFRGRWQTPEEAARSAREDDALAAKLAAYNARRDEYRSKLVPTKGGTSRDQAARAHVALGMWCERHGLKAEAEAHFTSAVVFAPYRDVTWRHLGYTRDHGRWVKPEQLAAEKAEAEAKNEAFRFWWAQLSGWREALGDPGRREDAERRLADVTDPRAVPAIVSVFTDGSAGDRLVKLQLLGQIDSPESTRELARIAVLTGSDSTLKEAVSHLRRRSSRDYAGMLVEQIRAPWTYRVVPVRGPGLPGALAVESPRVRWIRRYDAPLAFQLGSTFYGYVGYDSNGLPVVAKGREIDEMKRENPIERAEELAAIEARTASILAQAQWKAVASQQRLMADVREIEEFNARTLDLNERITTILRGAADAPSTDALLALASSQEAEAGPAAAPEQGDPSASPRGPDPENVETLWMTWWYDKLGYKYTPPPQVTVTVSPATQPAPPSFVSCFAAGTPVLTLTGPRPIEHIAVGDRVLSQDTATGALGYQTVRVVHHNPPGKTLRLALDDGQSVVASVYHRFWRAGRGWAMARELQAGDTLRTLRGPARIVSITEGAVVPLFNLDVAESRTFFVGAHGILVHDNTLPESRYKPFDAAPHLATADVR